MKRKRTPSGKREVQSSEPETVVPLDAEDFVLASLEAKVRSQESLVNLDSPGAPVSLTVRLPRAMISQLRAYAAHRKISISKLIKLAIARFLSQESAPLRDSSTR